MIEVSVVVGLATAGLLLYQRDQQRADRRRERIEHTERFVRSPDPDE